MAYFLGLLAAIVAFWVGNSGHYKPLMLAFGAASVVVTAVTAYRLNVVDREGAPYVRLPQLIRYYPWLAIEVFRSNWAVIRACLRAELDISPTLTKIRTVCRSDLAKVTFANSITMTPGTVTVEIDGDRLLVHGLYEAATQPEGFSEMDRRCARACDPEGGGA